MSMIIRTNRLLSRACCLLDNDKQNRSSFDYFWATFLVIIMPLAYMANRLDSELSHERG